MVRSAGAGDVVRTGRCVPVGSEPQMAPTTGIDALSDAVLARWYDGGAIRRGMTYAGQRRVRILGHRPGSLTGVVRGSIPNPYLVEVEWLRTSNGIVISDSCACPLGGACKHSVALVLAARADATRDPAIGSGSDWRRALSGLVADAERATTVEFPLALEVAIVQPKASRYAPDPSTQVTLRPLRMGKKGAWVKTGVSWQDISSPYQYSLRDVDAAPRAALNSLLGGARAGGYYPVQGAIPLNQFGPDVWFHLQRLVDTGVELVREGGRTGTVTLAPSGAATVVDLRADDAGAVSLSVRLELEGEPIGLQPHRSGLVGTPAHGVFIVDGDALTLAPIDRALHPALARLLVAPPLLVPASDVDELLDHYQPHLDAVARVGSSNGSVTITRTEFDGIVAIVERTAVDAASLHWGVRYRRGERVLTHPLDQIGPSGRDHVAEQVALADLVLPTHLLDSLADPTGRPRDLALGRGDTVTLLTEVVPWLLERDQVTVDITGEAPDLREAVGDPLISLAVTDRGDGDSDGTDWFDLCVEVSIDGEQVEFAALFAALNHDEKVLVLPSGTWLELDRPEFERLRSLIIEARGLADHDGAATVRINRFQASWWDDLTALGVVAQQSERWAAAVERLRELVAPEPVEPPIGLAASLRPYQQEGLDWLAFLHRHRLGGILADDMGLGKTVEALALCLHVITQQPDARVLVVAPTSVVENWHREATRFAPELAVRTIRETEARRGIDLVEAIDDARVVVTSYALFRIEFDSYRQVDWELLLLDEAQFVKNYKGKTYQCVRRLDASVKVAITGTPLENSLMDLWALLSITAPGLYPDPARFSEVYRVPIESGRAPELLATLRRRVAPLIRRRTKDDVLPELPPKTEQTVEVELSARHSRIYHTQLQRQRQKVLGLVDEVHKNRFEIFKSLTLLRQLSLDPGLVDDAHNAVGSAKLDRLVEDLTQVVAEGHRALVFSQFTRYLARVKTRLDDAGLGYSYLDGRTRKRDEAIARFKDGQVPVFVISLKAGGFGLNLTEADYCFVLDPWWNPAVETQAVDRTHRIGQRNPVVVYRYISVGTIEEKVMELKERKAALFANVMDADGALSGALTEDNIRGLLG